MCLLRGCGCRRWRRQANSGGWGRTPSIFLLVVDSFHQPANQQTSSYDPHRAQRGSSRNYVWACGCRYQTTKTTYVDSIHPDTSNMGIVRVVCMVCKVCSPGSLCAAMPCWGYCRLDQATQPPPRHGVYRITKLTNQRDPVKVQVDEPTGIAEAIIQYQSQRFPTQVNIFSWHSA